MFHKFLKMVHSLGTKKLISKLITVFAIVITSFYFRLLDIIISESPEKLNKSLYQKYFVNNLADLAIHYNGNFTIQKILSTTTDVTQVTLWSIKNVFVIKIIFLFLV